MFDARRSRRAARSQVGEHPNAMVLSRDGARLFVACANTNAVWVVDVADAKRERADLGRARCPRRPSDRRRTALALSPDGRTLLIANADNNTVTVVDVSKPGWSQVEGFIPAGWYPTGVLVRSRRQSDSSS